MVVDRNISPKDAFVNDLQRRQARHMVLSIFKQHLHRLELLLTYDRGMPVPIQILIAVLPVLSMLMLVKVCGERFPCQNASAVTFVRQDVPDCARRPLRTADLRLTTDIHKERRYLIRCPSCLVSIENEPDDPRFRLVDLKRRILDVSPCYVLRSVVTQ